MVVVTLLPMVIALLMLLKLGATRLVNGFDPDHKELQKLTFLLHLMEFFVLVPVSTTVLHFNKCITFYHEDGSEEEYLARDFRVDCQSQRYEDYGTYAVAMILVYPVGIPLHYATLLWSNREALQSGDAEAVERTHLSFLVGSYTEDFYWFEVLECTRRILLGSIIGIVSASAAAAPVMGLLLSIAFLVVYTRCRPFKVESDSNLAEVLAFSLCLFFTAALMIKVDATSDDEDDQEVFGLLLIGVLAAGPVLSVVEVFWDWLTVVVPKGAQENIAGGQNGRDSDVTIASGGTRMARRQERRSLPPKRTMARGKKPMSIDLCVDTKENRIGSIL